MEKLMPETVQHRLYVHDRNMIRLNVLTEQA